MNAGSRSMSNGEDGWARTIGATHDGYHAETRRHREPDVLVDDVVTWRMLSPHLIRALLFLVAPTVLLLIWLLLDYLASTSSPSITGRLIMNVVAVVTAVLYLAGIASFFAPAKEPIAEYSRLLEGRAGAARGAYQWVSRAATARRTPAEVTPSTVAGVPVLLFRQRSERAMLLVQPYGTDLYVGWTMWRSRSSATMLVHFLRDTFGRFAVLPVFSSELRAASTRAMRESVHSLAREGVAAATYAEELQQRRAGSDDDGGLRYDEHAPAERSEQHREYAERHRGYTEQHREYAAAPEPADPTVTERPPGDHRHADPGALPRSTPVPDPTSGWSAEDRAGEPVPGRSAGTPRRSTEGWGPPPRE